MSKPNSSPQSPQATGLWLVGARGAISTTVAFGLHALSRGLVSPVGIATATPAAAELDWVQWSQWSLGGHDVCSRSITASVTELCAANILPREHVDALAEPMQAFDSAIRPGLLDTGGSAPPPNVCEESLALAQLPPREQIAHLQKDWQEFESANGLAPVVVIYVASTEAANAGQPEWERLADLEKALDGGKSQPASLIYAYAALVSGRPFVNFTPNLGSNCGALRELAVKAGAVHCGNDGKTGETLLKTALAPMFHARALNVLAWQGYNMLGNRDGEVLRQAGHREAKLNNKDEALRSILQPGQDKAASDLHSHVGIDFVPSLGDWKTAWDYVHFEGFLGASMSLQFTWAGSDSALAAPLVLDLARLADLARRRGESGILEHTACFFKAPLGGGTHDFHRQYHRLLDYFDRAAQGATNP